MRLLRSMAIMLILCACAPMPSRLQNIPLSWKPTNSLSDISDVDLNSIMGVKLQVDKFTDLRKNPALIAENREDTQPKPVTTQTDVGAFVADNVRDTLRKLGLSVVDDAGQVTLDGEISDFFVIETHTYSAQVTLRITAHDPAGKVLWSGIVNGSATRFGRSYEAENYYEVLSDSILDATHSLLADASFRAAIAGK